MPSEILARIAFWLCMGIAFVSGYLCGAFFGGVW